MVVVTYATLHSVMNLNTTKLPAINTESVIDLAIDTLNLFGCELTNMAGTAGTKTVTLESNEKAAVFLVARMIYYSFYKSVDVASLGGINVTTNDLMKDPTAVQLIKDAADRLIKGSADDGMQVMVG
jgi:hypothetical protein